jgi:hypothetical protein
MRTTSRGRRRERDGIKADMGKSKRETRYRIERRVSVKSRRSWRAQSGPAEPEKKRKRMSE